MIFYCEKCKQYWKDGYNPTSGGDAAEWVYCTKDGIEISECRVCAGDN